MSDSAPRINASPRGRFGLRAPADALARAIAWGCVRALIGLLAAGLLVFHMLAVA